MLGVVIGWGGVGGTLAIAGLQEGRVGTAAVDFLRGGLLGIPLGLFVGLFAYLSTRAGRR